jgi:hypothetical protein
MNSYQDLVLIQWAWMGNLQIRGIGASQSMVGEKRSAQIRNLRSRI